MLKWTTTQQKFSDSYFLSTSNVRTPILSPSKRRKRRATIANKENIITSTPMGPTTQKFRLSPLVLAPLTDVINVKPGVIEPLKTPDGANHPRRYASTLPKFEEEYSPSTLLTGQDVAMRGLLPDTYLGNPRYFASPELSSRNAGIRKPLPKKRKLDLEFGDLQTSNVRTSPPLKKINVTSTQMGDQTLDKLIDAILDSARKDKKKKSRRSFNLRRRTLIKNTTIENVDSVLSPSYTPADDPASDLSFLHLEAVDDMIDSKEPIKYPTKVLKSEIDCGRYFEIGLALPSIYV